MIFVSNQLKAKPVPDFEQQFAAYNDLTQSLSEEFDRATELHAQAMQTTWESYSQFCSDMGLLKDPQEFFLRGTNQLHAWAGQSQQYLHALVALNQQIHEKFIALGQAISPMMLSSIVEVTPSTEFNFTPQSTADVTKPAVLKDINVVNKPVSKPKTANPRKRKTLASPTATATVVELASTSNSTTSAPSTPKARPVNTTKKSEASKSAESSSNADTLESAAPTKKSAVVGLPSKPPARSGFAGAAGQPDYKAKSSKATGAKKRVRQ